MNDDSEIIEFFCIIEVAYRNDEFRSEKFNKKELENYYLHINENLKLTYHLINTDHTRQFIYVDLEKDNKKNPLYIVDMYYFFNYEEFINKCKQIQNAEKNHNNHIDKIERFYIVSSEGEFYSAENLEKTPSTEDFEKYLTIFNNKYSARIIFYSPLYFLLNNSNLLRIKIANQLTPFLVFISILNIMKYSLLIKHDVKLINKIERGNQKSSRNIQWFLPIIILPTFALLIGLCLSFLEKFLLMSHPKIILFKMLLNKLLTLSNFIIAISFSFIHNLSYSESFLNNAFWGSLFAMLTIGISTYIIYRIISCINVISRDRAREIVLSTLNTSLINITHPFPGLTYNLEYILLIRQKFYYFNNFSTFCHAYSRDQTNKLLRNNNIMEKTVIETLTQDFTSAHLASKNFLEDILLSINKGG